MLKRLTLVGLPYWRYQGILLLFTLVVFVMYLPGPYLNQVLIDRIIQTGIKSDVHQILLVNLVIAFLIFSFSTIQGYLSCYVGSLVERDLQRDMFSKFQRLSMRFYETMPAGDIIYQATASLSQMNYFLLYELNIIVSNCLFVFLGAIILRVINVKLGLIAIVALPLSALLAQYFNNLQLPVEQKIQTQSAKIYSAYANNIANIGLVRSYAREDHEKKQFFETISGFLRISVDRILLNSVSNNLLTKTSMVFSALLMWVGGLSIIDGDLTVGEIFAFTSFLAYLWTPTDGLLLSLSGMPTYLLAALRVFFVMDADVNDRQTDGTMDLPEIEGEIEFHEVSFGYHPTQTIIEDLNLVVAPGEKVAVVGASGSGKSTLVKLLLRYYDVQRGSIFIDGFHLPDICMASLREKIGVVMQNQFVFPGTVRDNIRYGRLDATDDEVVEAARNANAHEFIMQLENGYDTPIGGEGGVSLSGGEGQRVAIARVILKKAPIVILDEATSALDNQTEVLVQGALDYLMRDRTCLIVAHRLSTIMDVDRVYVFDQGRVVESGPPHQLLEAGGFFADLYHRKVRRDD